MGESKGNMVYMCGYLPGSSEQRSQILSPAPVRKPDSGESWKDVCGGGCGFAMVISESGKLITWGSAEDQGQSYMTCGKHGENPEPFLLPTKDPIAKAAAGWAHCASVTETGDVYTWGWKECVPSVKLFQDLISGGNSEKESLNGQNSSVTDEGDSSKASLKPEETKSNDNRKGGEENVKRRRVFPTKQESDSPIPIDEALWAPPNLASLGQGVKICAVAAGGRHTLALSDMGQVWGWGYGGEGQLGLGTRIKMVSSPHLIPCIEESTCAKDKTPLVQEGSSNANGQNLKAPGSYVKGIACGGRHSAVITDSGALLTFGWGLYGQTLPRLLDSPTLENKHAKIVSCGARHSAIITDDLKLFCWGWNKYGQLGLGDAIDRNIPSQVHIEGYLPMNVACGWWHTLLLADCAPSV